MEILNLETLRAYNKCPLMSRYLIFYHREPSLSRTFFTELTALFDALLCRRMQERITKKTVNKFWKELAANVEKAHPSASPSDFEFPAQCLATFLEEYEDHPDHVLGVKVPFDLQHQEYRIADHLPLLTRTPYGTRLTIFQMLPQDLPEIQLANDIFLTLYAAGYRKEFDKLPVFLTVHNLGTGRKTDLVKTPKDLLLAMADIWTMVEQMDKGPKVPNEGYCSSCDFLVPCHQDRYAARR